MIKVVKNYKNVCKTLSSRHQIHNAYCNISLVKDIEYGKGKSMICYLYTGYMHSCFLAIGQTAIEEKEKYGLPEFVIVKR